jgi:hypothetical protein
MQVNAETFQPIVAHPFQMQRPHGWHGNNGAMWVVDGVDEARLVKIDARTARRARAFNWAQRSRSHGLAMLNGKLYFCDAGIHPGWDRDKPAHGVGVSGG